MRSPSVVAPSCRRCVTAASAKGVSSMSRDDEPVVRRFDGAGASFRWQDVPLLDYKSDTAGPFHDITRQTLFKRDDMKGELRYFEVAAGGHSTLERHDHTHAAVVSSPGGLPIGSR